MVPTSRHLLPCCLGTVNLEQGNFKLFENWHGDVNMGDHPPMFHPCAEIPKDDRYIMITEMP